MRTIELTNDEMEAACDGDEYGVVDWKAPAGDVLELIDDQLAAFGLEVVEVDTGADDFMWKIEKRVAP